MNTIKNILGYLILAGIFGVSCKKSELASINTQPGFSTTAPPASLFLNATQNVATNFEAYYDNNRFLYPLAQIFTNSTANPRQVTTNTLTDGNSLSNRFSNFFSTSGLGNYCTDAEREFYIYYSASDQANRISWVPIFRILKAYYAFYVSDVYGSIAYTQGFKAKEGIYRPVFDPQENLFDTLDTQLKAAVASLKTAKASATEITLGNYDQFFGTAADPVTEWIKTANSLRLKIAMRLIKRNPTKLASIANEVLSDNVGVMSSNSDSWLFQPASSYWGGSGNWDPTSLSAKGIKGTIDFMWKNSDPRMRNFYQQNNYSQANINIAIAAGILGAGTTEPARRYVGSYASHDAASAPANSRLQNTVIVNNTLTLDTLSTIQDRLISPYNNGGSGSGTFILLSYADVCLMRAELAARSITTENAQILYVSGITASINMYDAIASLAKVYNYTTLSSAEISTYLAAPNVVYNPSNALAQIIEQEYINYFLQPNEAWALVKRTGMPNATTDLVYETFMIGGSLAPYPRRATLSNPSQSDDNYANEIAALTGMEADPSFGVPGDNSGRIWWDMP